MSDKINLFDLNDPNEPEENNQENEHEEIETPQYEEDEYLFENGFSFADEDEYDEYGYADYEEEESEEEIKSRKKKKLIKSIIWAAVIVVVSLSLAWGIIVVGADYLGIGFGRGHNVEITIPQGASTKQIAEILQDKGIVKSPFAFRMYAKLKGYDSRFQSGTRVIDSDAGYGGIADALTEKGVVRKSVKVTVLEGWNIDQIAEELEKKQVCTAEDFKFQIRDGEFDFDFVKDIPSEEVYYRLEGYLYPDTYDFLCFEDNGFTSKQCAYYAIDKMLQNFDKKLSDDLIKKINKSDYNLHQIISLASVIEMEAGKAAQENRNKVAAVFYNRIEGNNWSGLGYLQSDPTTYYPYGNSKYNTYKTAGIPVGPLCSPRIECIKAAVSPAKDKKIVFFVTDSEGKFYFNETLSGHNKTVNTLKAQGKWVYGVLGDG